MRIFSVTHTGSFGICTNVFHNVARAAATSTITRTLHSFSSVRVAVIDWWKGPLTLVVFLFALCLLLLTWSVAGIACSCHSSGTFSSSWLTQAHTQKKKKLRTRDPLPLSQFFAFPSFMFFVCWWKVHLLGVYDRATSTAYLWSFACDSLVGATECAVGPFFCVQEGKLKMCCESKAKNSQAEPCSGSLSWEYISTGKNHQTRVISFDCSGARPSPCFHNLTDLTGSSNLSVR